MTVEPIHDLPDFDGNDGLLAVVIRSTPLPFGTHFVTEPHESQQVGLIHYTAGHRIAPHKHQEVVRQVRMTQEVLFIRRGVVRVSLFNTLGVPVKEVTLASGEAIVLLNGGHGFEFLTECELIEAKNGPYAGINDKVCLGPAEGAVSTP